MPPQNANLGRIRLPLKPARRDAVDQAVYHDFEVAVRGGRAE
jgi:hypothetical protein